MSVDDRPRIAPPTRLRRLPLGQVRPAGWMRAQMRRDLDQGFAGRLDALSPHVANDLFARRLSASGEARAWWDAESRGHWLWGYLMLSHLADAPDHARRADALVQALRATQDADGYLGIYASGLRHSHGGAENGELWAQSRALLVLLAHHELSGDAQSLAAVQAAVRHTRSMHGPQRPFFGRQRTGQDMTGVTHGLCMIDALQALHEASGDAPAAAFAVELLDDFDAWPGPFPNDDLAAAALAEPMRPLHGHAVHTIEHLRALVWVRGAGSAAVATARRKLAASTTPSGALIGDEGLHGVPGPGAAYETCTLVEGVFSAARLSQALGEAACGDALETLAFNAAQGARQADGRALAYLCADDRLDARASRPDSYSWLSGTHGRYKLSPTHDDVACCCNPNALRLWPHYLQAMWLAQDGPGESGQPPALVAMAYGPCELATTIGGVAVQVVQDTRYPFEDELRFAVTVAQPVRFALRLRRPGWARGMHLHGLAEGGADLCADPDGFVTLDRRWSGRCEFSLRIDVGVRAQPYPGGEIAVLRGPLQFVWPIAHRVRTLRGHALPGFHDSELWPADAVALATTPVLDPTRPDLGLAPRWQASADTDDPWQNPPLVLHRDGAPGRNEWPERPGRPKRPEWPERPERPEWPPGLTLQPMGCTPLRRAGLLAVAAEPPPPPPPPIPPPPPSPTP